jgi:hypothetical protein
VNTQDLAFLREHVATIDGSRPERLDEVRGRIRRARRRRATGRAVVASVLLVLAVAGGAVVNAAHRSPEPAGRIRGGQVVAHHPYLWWMAPGWHLYRQMGAAPSPLTRCADAPGSWGAVESQVAVFTNPSTPSRWVNEFVLRYANASSAQHAFLDAWHKMKICPRPGHTVDRRLLTGQRFAGQSLVNAHAASTYDHGFYWANRWPRDNHPAPEQRMVARAGNVLVVLEGNVWAKDTRIEDLVYQAVQQALPDYVNLP